MPSAPAVTTAARSEDATRDVVRRRSLVDHAVLALIGVVVVLVSLPLLRRFALHENETDAIRALRALGEEMVARPPAGSPPELAALVASSPGRRMLSEDLEVLADGRLRRHGYMFAWVGGDDGERAPGAGGAIVAWPWEHGRTGLAAFAIEPGGPVLGLANADGRYSGPRRRPPPPLRAREPGEALVWTPLAAD
jgi:hypothetical protein